MSQRIQGFIEVTRPDFSTDSLLTSSLKTDGKVYVVDNTPYYITYKLSFRHLVHPPGFGSSFDSNNSLQKILNDLDLINFDTAFLQFLSPDLAKIFESNYTLGSKKYSSLSSRMRIKLDLHNKNIHDLLINVKRGTKQKINSAFDGYEIIDTYSSQFSLLYNQLSKEKLFHESYKYSSDFFYELSLQPDIYFFGIQHNNELLAGSFYRIYSNNLTKKIDYLFSASRVNSSSKWAVKLIWKGIELGINKNCSSFNFGGGTDDNDSLSNFKLGFGGVAQIFYRCRVISRRGDKRDDIIRLNLLDKTFFP